MPSDIVIAIKSHIRAVPPSRAVPPPLTEADVAQAETALGFPLPPLLRELYLHVGNGGFGPDRGILSLENASDWEQSAVEIYLQNRQESPTLPEWKWPAAMLPICDWGCAMFSCLDCANPPYAVLTFEYVSGPMENSFIRSRDSLESWLRDWLAGIEVFDSLYEPAPELDRIGRNPRTGEPMVFKARKLKRRT
jgi:SMI1 / KNR4 family (SUKH-1)